MCTSKMRQNCIHTSTKPSCNTSVHKDNKAPSHIKSTLASFAYEGFG